MKKRDEVTQKILRLQMELIGQHEVVIQLMKLQSQEVNERLKELQSKYHHIFQN
jgi:hypothetical protein